MTTILLIFSVICASAAVFILTRETQEPRSIAAHSESKGAAVHRFIDADWYTQPPKTGANVNKLMPTTVQRSATGVPTWNIDEA